MMKSKTLSHTVQIFIFAYAFIVAQTYLVWNTNIPEDLVSYWIPMKYIPYVLKSVYFVVPLHLIYVGARFHHSDTKFRLLLTEFLLPYSSWLFFLISAMEVSNP